MFDKVRSGGIWGLVGVVLVTLAAKAFPQVVVPEGASVEETVTLFLIAAVPVAVGWVASWLRRERSGYGATTTVITSGRAAETVVAPTATTYAPSNATRRRGA